eukprot:COSAG02_NODE_607_length_19608_cov_33.568968_16_plen_93_part_00
MESTSKVARRYRLDQGPTAVAILCRRRHYSGGGPSARRTHTGECIQSLSTSHVLSSHVLSAALYEYSVITRLLAGQRQRRTCGAGMGGRGVP